MKVKVNMEKIDMVKVFDIVFENFDNLDQEVQIEYSREWRALFEEDNFSGKFFFNGEDVTDMYAKKRAHQKEVAANRVLRRFLRQFPEYEVKYRIAGWIE